MPSTLNATTTNGLVTSADNSGSLQLQTNNGTTAVTIDTSQNVGVGTTTPSYKLNVQSASATDGIAARFTNTGSTGAGIDFLQSGVDNFSLSMPAGAGGLRFIASGTNERARITSGGDLCVGTTSLDLVTPGFGVSTVSGVCNGVQIVKNNGNWGTALYIRRNSGVGTGFLIEFNYNGTQVGTISSNTTNASYNTVSDYRLKENIAPMQNALGVVSQLKPVTYNWKVDGSSGQGFIAHELQEVVPDCVTGEKDSVDAEGNPVYQGVDTSFLVATLTAAIQELKVELDSVKAEVQLLKNPPVEGTE